jgi:hypothetical protein
MPQIFDMSKRSQPPRPRLREPEPDRPITLTGTFDEAMRNGPGWADRDPGGTASQRRESPPAMIALRQVLSALAHEETALAHLLHAEAEKVQALTMAVPASVPFDALLEYQRSVHDMLQLVIRKEEVLLNKLKLVASLTQLAMEEGN